MSGQPVRFPNESGEPLVGRLESPAHCKPRAYALYAHCFTCGKDVRAAVDISRALCKQGIAVLRFDFTGLGESAGSFADTTFSTNISDLLAAVRFLEQTHEAPKILIGHSLGGTAILEAAHRVPSCIAIITIAAPASPEHVVRLLGSARDAIEDRGVSAVMLAGRKFQFKKAFLDDLKTQHWEDNIRALRKPLLIFHSPTDMTVDITNAAEIFAAARHPKSFVALTGADHLLSRPEDSEYVGLMIAAWATKYLGELGMVATSNLATEGEIVVQMGESIIVLTSMPDSISWWQTSPKTQEAVIRARRPTICLWARWVPVRPSRCACTLTANAGGCRAWSCISRIQRFMLTTAVRAPCKTRE